jgi:hypothetical protein
MKLIITLTAFLLCAISSFAQQQLAQSQNHSNAEDNEAARVDNAINSYRWDTLQGKISVIYSKNYKVRARTIQKLIDECMEFYKPAFPETKFNLYAMILSQEDWNKIHLNESVPYGMPNANTAINKLFIAADKKAVGKLAGEPDNLPDNMLSKFDCIALHEVGHIFLIRYNHTSTQKKWADEFLASYFAICFFEQHKNYPGLPQAGETGYSPKYITLADFERLYFNVGAQNYGWYQGQFQNLGYELYPKFKTELLKKFIDNYSDAGKKLPPLDLLKQLAPEITNQWLKGME